MLLIRLSEHNVGSKNSVLYDILTAVTMKDDVFWDMTPCGSSKSRWPRDTPLSRKVGTNIRRPVAVAQSVYFANGLNVKEFVYFVCVSSKNYILIIILDLETKFRAQAIHSVYRCKLTLGF
jgi:hypothetical protein